MKLVCYKAQKQALESAIQTDVILVGRLRSSFLGITEAQLRASIKSLNTISL